MALDSRHPEYSTREADWRLMRHAHAGERAVKGAGNDYLPATAGQLLDWDSPLNVKDPTGQIKSSTVGQARYEAYKKRAEFPSYVTEAVEAMVGIICKKPAVIELPKSLEPLIARATLNGESLQLLLRRIYEAQLITGRIGLLLDLPANPGANIPYIATYEAENIINWDNGTRTEPALQTLNLVVLDESEYERNSEFNWEKKQKYRVLVLGDLVANESNGVYRQGLFVENTNFDESALIEPGIRGNTLEQIPFVFINTSDLLPEPCMPPLLKLANKCMTIYRGDADHRQALHLQGQDTFVIRGGDETKTYRLGAGSVVCVPIDGGATFEGVNSSGIPEQRETLQNDHRAAKEMSGQLIDTTSREKESGEALKVRVAAKTATLNQIVLTGAEGLQSSLRIAGIWTGMSPEQAEKEITVKPNLDFAEAGYTPADFLILTQAKREGLPITEEDLFNEAKKAGFTTVKDYEEAKLRLAEERAKVGDELLRGVA